MLCDENCNFDEDIILRVVIACQVNVIANYIWRNWNTAIHRCH